MITVMMVQLDQYPLRHHYYAHKKEKGINERGVIQNWRKREGEIEGKTVSHLGIEDSYGNCHHGSVRAGGVKGQPWLGLVQSTDSGALLTWIAQFHINEYIACETASY